MCMRVYVCVDLVYEYVCLSVSVYVCACGGGGVWGDAIPLINDGV